MTRLATLLTSLVVLIAAAGFATAGTAKAPPTDSCVPKSLRGNAISFRTGDGVRISGILLGSGANGVVLAHELRASVCNWISFAQTLAGAGYRVLAYDSRNAGVSARPPYPTYLHLERDLLAAQQELLRRGAKRVAFGGASAGGTAAMTAAASAGKTLAGVLVLSSPAQYVVMDAEAAAKRVTAPSFFAVGREDDGFPAGMQKLYAASAAENKKLELVDTGAHGTRMLIGAEGAAMRSKLLAFLADAFHE
jgi:pimeloyl-ACP methyl ester carboxylesterase